MKIIGICGLIGSGKDTIAQIIKENNASVKHFSFAGILKDIISIIFDWDRALLQGDTVESRKWREEEDTWWSARLEIPNFTPRTTLQYIGTNVLRDNFHPDIWIAAIERRILQCAPDDIIVITDCRFPNEIDMLRRLGGKIVWVQRGDLPDWCVNYIIKGEIPTQVHPSEYSWLNTKFDAVIKNDGTLEELTKDVLPLLN